MHVHQNQHKTISFRVNTSQQLTASQPGVTRACSKLHFYISTGRQMERMSRKASEPRWSLPLFLSLCKVMLQQIMFVPPAPAALTLERDLPAAIKAGALNTLGIIKH